MASSKAVTHQLRVISRKLNWKTRMKMHRYWLRKLEKEREELRARRGFSLIGKKKIYIPNHIVTLLRPKANQSPTTAVFEVPLSFNKFDLRDYLWHLYKVGTDSVRSFVVQPPPQQRNLPGKNNGKWYRPRALKRMIVDLKKPFTWPMRPTEPKELEPWDNKMFVAVESAHEEALEKQRLHQKGTPRLRQEEGVGPARKKLAELAKDILAGKKAWDREQGWVEGAQNVKALREKRLKNP